MSAPANSRWISLRDTNVSREHNYPLELKVGDTATYRDGDTEYPVVVTAIDPGVHPEMTTYHLESPR